MMNVDLKMVNTSLKEIPTLAMLSILDLVELSYHQASLILPMPYRVIIRVDVTNAGLTKLLQI